MGVAANKFDLFEKQQVTENEGKEWAEKILTFNINEIEMKGLEDWDMNNVIHKLEDIYNGKI